MSIIDMISEIYYNRFVGYVYIYFADFTSVFPQFENIHF